MENGHQATGTTTDSTYQALAPETTYMNNGRDICSNTISTTLQL